MIGPIENQIAMYANEPEQRVAGELYPRLCNGVTVYINDEPYELIDFTDMLIKDVTTLSEAVQDSVTGNTLAVHQLYIAAISNELRG